MPLQLADIPSHLSMEFHSPSSAIEKGATIPELYDWHAKENPDYPLFSYHDGEKSEYITYSSANRAIDRVARYVLSGLGPVASTAERGAAKLPTVAIFARAGTSEQSCCSSTSTHYVTVCRYHHVLLHGYRRVQSRLHRVPRFSA